MLTQSYLETAFNFHVSDFSIVSHPTLMWKENFFSDFKTFADADIISLNDKPRYRWVSLSGQEKKYPYWSGPTSDWYTYWNYYRCYFYSDFMPFDMNSWLFYRFVVEKTPTSNVSFLREMDFTTAYLFTFIECGISLACLNYFLLAWDPELKYWFGRQFFYDVYLPLLDQSIFWSYQFFWMEPGVEVMRLIHFNFYI